MNQLSSLRPFSRLDRYVMGHFLVPLLASAGIGLFLLVGARFIRVFETVVTKRDSFSVVMEMLAYTIPHFLSAIIPLAIFIGLMLGFNRLSKTSEIVAYMAAGLSLTRLVRALLFPLLALMLTTVILMGWVSPYGEYAYRFVLNKITSTGIFFFAEEGAFFKYRGQTIVIDEIEKSDGSFKKLFVYTLDKQTGATETLTARTGRLSESNASSGPPVLLLESGTQLYITPPAPDQKSDELTNYRVTEFNTSTRPMTSDRRAKYRARGYDQKELTLWELYQRLDTPPPGATRDAMSAEFHKRLVKIMMVLTLPILAMPFAIAVNRDLRSFRFLFAALVLLAYVQVIEQGAVISRTAGYSPIFTLWLPTFFFMGFALKRFWALCFSVQRDSYPVVLIWYSAAADYIRDAFSRRPNKPVQSRQLKRRQRAAR